MRRSEGSLSPSNGKLFSAQELGSASAQTHTDTHKNRRIKKIFRPPHTYIYPSALVVVYNLSSSSYISLFVVEHKLLARFAGAHTHTQNVENSVEKNVKKKKKLEREEPSTRGKATRNAFRLEARTHAIHLTAKPKRASRLHTSYTRILYISTLSLYYILARGMERT